MHDLMQLTTCSILLRVCVRTCMLLLVCCYLYVCVQQVHAVSYINVVLCYIEVLVAAVLPNYLF